MQLMMQVPLVVHGADSNKSFAPCLRDLTDERVSVHEHAPFDFQYGSFVLRPAT
jgi:hypothetical protein